MVLCAYFNLASPICSGYKKRIWINLPNIIGEIDGMLVWVKKTAIETSDDVKCGQKTSTVQEKRNMI